MNLLIFKTLSAVPYNERYYGNQIKSKMKVKGKNLKQTGRKRRNPILYIFHYLLCYSGTEISKNAFIKPSTQFVGLLACLNCLDSVTEEEGVFVSTVID